MRSLELPGAGSDGSLRADRRRNAGLVPDLKQAYTFESMLQEIFDANHDRWACR